MKVLYSESTQGLNLFSIEVSIHRGYPLSEDQVSWLLERARLVEDLQHKSMMRLWEIRDLEEQITDLKYDISCLNDEVYALNEQLQDGEIW